jgi:hypothetical protein
MSLPVNGRGPENGGLDAELGRWLQPTRLTLLTEDPAPGRAR